jgi:hypothetical protein
MGKSILKQFDFILIISFFQYKCVHNNFSGTLYAGPLALVFLGRIFFFEWTVVIKWEDVVHVLKQDNGVRVEVSSPKPTTFDFEQLFNPDKAWSSLVSLHNDTIIDAPRPGPTPRSVSRSLRRGNSDPLLQLSKLFDFEEPPTIYEAPSTDEKIESDTDTGTSTATAKTTTLKKEWSDILEDSTSYAAMAVEVSSSDVLYWMNEFPCLNVLSICFI